jgi:hypothetical protein
MTQHESNVPQPKPQLVPPCSVSVSGEEIRGLEEHGALDSWCNQII